MLLRCVPSGWDNAGSGELNLSLTPHSITSFKGGSQKGMDRL